MLTAAAPIIYLLGQKLGGWLANSRVGVKEGDKIPSRHFCWTSPSRASHNYTDDNAVMTYH